MTSGHVNGVSQCSTLAHFYHWQQYHGSAMMTCMRTN